MNWISSLAVSGAATLTLLSTPLSANAVNSQVSSILPKGSTEGFFLYNPSPQATPMLRSGVMELPPYSFELAGDFSAEKIPTPETGSYCSPKCTEPWKEAYYASASNGRVELLSIVTEKFTPRKGVTIVDLGTPEVLLNALGPYLTGSSFDADEVEIITASSRKNPVDGESEGALPLPLLILLNSPFLNLLV